MNAKAVNTLLGCLSQSEFVKVMRDKSAKEIWDKIVLSYEGDDQVKRAKLQTLKIQYENLRMPPIFDGTNFVYWKVRVTAYLQSLGTEVWDIKDTGDTFPSATPTDPAEKKKYETNAKAVNTLLGFLSQSEFVKVMQFKSAKEIWDKIVLSYEGDDQVKRAKLQTLRIQYENIKMYNDESVANYVLRVDEIVNCMKNLGEEVKEAAVVEKVLRSLSLGHYATKCPHKDRIDKGKEPVRWNKKHNANKKSYYTHEDSDGLSNSDEDERANHYKLLMAFEDDDYVEAIDVDGFYEEISRLKRCLEEKNMIIDTLQFQLDEKEKSLEKLECEIVGLRKEIEKTKALNLKFVKGSETLDEIISVQRSPLIKTGPGYNGEASQASTSKSYLDAARRGEQKPNRNHQVNQGQSSSRTNKDYQENRGHATLRTNRSYNQPQVKSSQFSSIMDGSRNYNRLDDSRRNFFNGQCLSCHKFGHKAAQCVVYKTIMTREAQKQRSMSAITKRTYNNFSTLEIEIECSICNNFGHEDSECRSRFWKTTQKEQTSSAKSWRMKEPQLERCGIALYAEGQENQWYIDNGCSKHMTGDKEKLESYTALEKGKKVSFGNDTPVAIKGKGIAQLK
eukprot:PITA_28481